MIIWQLSLFILAPGLVVLIAIMMERLLRVLHLRWLAGVLLGLTVITLTVRWHFSAVDHLRQTLNFELIKILLPGLLTAVMLSYPWWLKAIIRQGLSATVLRPQGLRFWRDFYISQLLLALTALLPLLPHLEGFSPTLSWFGAMSYWLSAVVLQLATLNRLREIRRLCHKINAALSSARNLNIRHWLEWLQQEFSLPPVFMQQVFDDFSTRKQAGGEVVALELDGVQWLFSRRFYDERMAHFSSLTSQRLYHNEHELQLAFRQCFSLPERNGLLCSEHYGELVRLAMQQ